MSPSSNLVAAAVLLLIVIENSEAGAANFFGVLGAALIQMFSQTARMAPVIMSHVGKGAAIGGTAVALDQGIKIMTKDGEEQPVKIVVAGANGETVTIYATIVGGIVSGTFFILVLVITYYLREFIMNKLKMKATHTQRTHESIPLNQLAYNTNTTTTHNTHTTQPQTSNSSAERQT